MLWKKEQVRDVARIMRVRISLIQKMGWEQKARQSEKVSAKALRWEIVSSSKVNFTGISEEWNREQNGYNKGKTASKRVARKAARNPEVHDVIEAKEKKVLRMNYAECCQEGKIRAKRFFTWKEQRGVSRQESHLCRRAGKGLHSSRGIFISRGNKTSCLSGLDQILE